MISPLRCLPFETYICDWHTVCVAIGKDNLAQNPADKEEKLYKVLRNAGHPKMKLL